MFKIELKGLKEVEKMLDPKIYQAAATSTVNKLMAKAKTAAVDKAVTIWNIKKSDLTTSSTGKARLQVRRATWGDMTATLTITGRPLSLSLFGAKQVMGGSYRAKKVDSIRQGRVTAKMKKAGPLPQGVLVQLQKGKTTLLRSAFMARVKAGDQGHHVGVYQRQGPARLPILEKRLITVPSMFAQPRIMQAVEKAVSENTQKIFNHELEFYLNRGR
jgi:hypothetical protein